MGSGFMFFIEVWRFVFVLLFLFWIVHFLFLCSFAPTKKKKTEPKEKEIRRMFRDCKYFSSQFTCHLKYVIEAG